MEYTKEPVKVLKVGNAVGRVYAPVGLTPEEIERREDALYDAMADILLNAERAAHRAGDAGEGSEP